ncbi:MAG TPA: transcriptional regulator [Cyclobacteriaceae bacterium]|nr:transcriptional regulator [Cyclobacteriaceae bacterium]
MFDDLDPILHSQLRLAVISILVRSGTSEFTSIQEETGSTSGNLSVQIYKLKEAGYIEIEKKFKGNYPQTICRITPLGIEKFNQYVNSLRGYLRAGDKDKS